MRRIILGMVLWAALFGAWQARAQLMMTGAGRAVPGGSTTVTKQTSPTSQNVRPQTA